MYSPIKKERLCNLFVRLRKHVGLEWPIGSLPSRLITNQKRAPCQTPLSCFFNNYGTCILKGLLCKIFHRLFFVHYTLIPPEPCILRLNIFLQTISNSWTYSDLGMRQHCRDNVTMFSGRKMVDYCLIFVLASSFMHRCRFLSLMLYYCTLARCRCREAIQLSRAQLWLSWWGLKISWHNAFKLMGIENLLTHCL